MTAAKVIALEYHDVVADGAFDESGFTGRAAASYKLSVDNFAAHLSVLTAPGIPVRSAAHPVTDLAVGGVMLTFDDGGASAFTHIAPLLEERGLSGAFFVTTDHIDTRGFLTRTQITELHRRGHVIGSHSCSHPTRMAECSASELQHEWGDSVARLSDVIGGAVTTASVPGGYYSRDVGEAAAAAGVTLLFTSEPSTRVTRCGDGRCIVLGRYTLRQADSAQRVAALVGASPLTRRAEWLKWNSKKVAKALGGRAYLRLREAVFREP